MPSKKCKQMQGSPLETDDLAAPPRRIPRQIVIIHWSLAVAAALRKRLREPLAAPVLPSSAVLDRKRWCWFGQGGMKTIVRTRLRRFFATITYWHGNILRPTGEIDGYSGRDRMARHGGSAVRAGLMPRAS